MRVGQRENKVDTSEASIGVDISVFLGTVSLFFVGILLAKLSDLNSQIKLGIIFLIVATFAFIFSAIIYANAVGASRKGAPHAHHHLRVGNSLAEFLGLYIFIVAVPLVVNSLTTDTFMQLSVLTITIVSLVIYTSSPYSLADRVLSKKGQWFYSILVLLFVSCLTIGQVYIKDMFIPIGVCVLLFFVVSSVLFSDNT